MTATLDGMATRKKGNPEPTAEQKLAEELVARAREQGVALTGPDGLLKLLTKTVLETALNQEMTEMLGHLLRQRPFQDGLGHLGQQPIRAQQLGALGLRLAQQLISQLVID